MSNEYEVDGRQPVQINMIMCDSLKCKKHQKYWPVTYTLPLGKLDM